MAFISIPDSWIQVGKALVQRLFQRIKDNLDSLNSGVGVLTGTDILNGFFEIVEEIGASPLRPASWDVTEYLGGTVELDDNNSRKGQYSLKFNHPGGVGNGGGQAVSDYYALSPDKAVSLAQTFRSTNAAVRIKVMVDYFDEDKVFIIASTETLYNQNSGIPSAATRKLLYPSPPSGARYLKYKFVGGDTDTDPGSSADIFLDEVTINAIDAGAVTQEKLGYQPGTEIILSNNALTTTTSTTYVKLKEMVAARTGLITVSLDMGVTPAGGGDTAYAQIRVDGVDAGAEMSTTYGGFVTFTRDIEVTPGALVQVYCKQSGGTTTDLKNVRLLNLYPISEENTLS